MKNAAFEKWCETLGLPYVGVERRERLQRIFEAGQRASDPLRREKEAVVRAAKNFKRYLDTAENSHNTRYIRAIDKACDALQSAQRSRRHGK